MHQKTLFLIKSIHRWIGLAGGWFLFIIIISGSLTLFDSEINQWMRPELARVKPAPLSSKALDNAYKIWTYSQNMPKNLIKLPSSRDPYLYVSYLKGNIKRNIVLDPHEGNIIPVRNTAGASFIVSIHKKLYMNPRYGQFILLIVAFFFILSIITGVILHYKPFIKMLFNLQVKAAPLRQQLNYHTSIGIIFLPFLFIIALSGFLFIIPHYLPSPHPQSKPENIYKDNLNTLSKQNLLNLVNETERYFNNPAGFIFFTPKEIKIGEANNSHLTSFKNLVGFDKTTGKLTSHSSLSPMFGYPEKVIFGIHMARAGGAIFRTINFILGLGSAFCVAFGLLYYSNRHKNKLFTNKITYIGYKTIEGINTSVIMGTLIGFISLLWINRFIPFDFPNRIHNEIFLFFTICLLVCIYGFLSAYFNYTNNALKKLMTIFSYLCLLLPIVDLLFNNILIKASLLNGNFLFIKMDGTVFILGIVSLLFCSYLNKKSYLS